jgi:SAM-dependent methyltransferase
MTREAPDRASSSEAYAARFSGKTGAWLLSVQNHALLDLLAPHAGNSTLDVGGGHGQYTGDLLQAGQLVTVLGSDPAGAPRLASLIESGRCRYVAGDFLNLPFETRKFDTVLCFRQLAHMDNVDRFLEELTRVCARALIVDFPPRRSFNALDAALFPVKRLLEKRSTRRFRIFDEKELVKRVAGLGFTVTGRYAQFALPMVLHRTLRIPALSCLLETPLRRLGVTDRIGSPVILRFERRGNECATGESCPE